MSGNSGWFVFSSSIANMGQKIGISTQNAVMYSTYGLRRIF